MNPIATMMLALSLCGAAPSEVELSLSGGRTLRGALVELNERQVTLHTADGDVTQPTSQLLALAPVSPPEARPAAKASLMVTLVDGTVLPATRYTVTGGIAAVTAPGRDGELAIPTAAIAHVWLGDGPTGDLARQWVEIIGQKFASDVLVVLKRDTLDFLEGVVGEVSASTIQFTLDEEVVPVKRGKALGLVYFHPDDDAPGAVGVATTVDGLQLALHKVSWTGDNVTVTTPAGVELTLPAASLVRIDFSQGKVMYLGDLKPESVEWTPYLGTTALVPAAAAFYQPRVDAAFDGGPLRLDGQVFAHGVALRSKTEIVYRLPGKFGRFTALAGIDDAVRPQGNVRLEIRGDDRVLMEASIDGAAKALPIDVDLTGVSRLKIIVDFGNDLDVGDQLDLGDARIAK